MIVSVSERVRGEGKRGGIASFVWWYVVESHVIAVYKELTA